MMIVYNGSGIYQEDSQGRSGHDQGTLSLPPDTFPGATVGYNIDCIGYGGGKSEQDTLYREREGLSIPQITGQQGTGQYKKDGYYFQGGAFYENSPTLSAN